MLVEIANEVLCPSDPHQLGALIFSISFDEKDRPSLQESPVRHRRQTAVDDDQVKVDVGHRAARGNNREPRLELFRDIPLELGETKRIGLESDHIQPRITHTEQKICESANAGTKLEHGLGPMLSDDGR